MTGDSRIITASDCQKVGLCAVPGQRDFCLRHGLDFKRFVLRGLRFDEVAHIDDANLKRALAFAAARIGREQGRGQ